MTKKLNIAEVSIDELVEQAKKGNKNVLGEIIRRIQDNIYNLAIRMLFIPADAQDATQEILVKVITNLGLFKGESRFDTWVYSVASNHLLTMRKSRAERWKMTFDVCVNLIEEETLVKEDGVFIEAEQNLMVEETKLACVHYLLLCLNRDLRLAFILGEIFGVKSSEAAKILGVTPLTYRQRLSRGRKQILDFLVGKCSLVDSKNHCNCNKLAVLHVQKKNLNPKAPYFAAHPCRTPHDSHSEGLLKELNQLARAAMLIRSHPQYAAPGVLVESMRGLIDSGRFQLFGE